MRLMASFNPTPMIYVLASDHNQVLDPTLNDLSTGNSRLILGRILLKVIQNVCLLLGAGRFVVIVGIFLARLLYSRVSG